MVQERMNDLDEEEIDQYAHSGLIPAIGGVIMVCLVSCIIPFADGYRAVKRLHIIWKGVLVSALAGVAISLMLFLVAYLLLEGIL